MALLAHGADNNTTSGPAFKALVPNGLDALRILTESAIRQCLRKTSQGGMLRLNTKLGPRRTTKMAESYEDRIRTLRKTKQLHPVVEARLVALLRRAFPDSATIPEVSAIPGGRNDLLQYFFDGRRVVIEIFGSASQVPQDLRLLEQCDAAVKIAVLLDREVDNSVATEYFRKKPGAFPYIWLRHVLEERWTPITLARLRELIDERHSVTQLRRLLATGSGAAVDRVMRGVLSRVGVKLAGNKVRSLAQLTGKEVLALKILATIKNMGMPVEQLRSLYQWLVLSVEHAIEIVGCGFQAFLISDLASRHAIWSDGDLADDLIIGASDVPKAHVVVCLNPIVNDFFVQHGMKKSDLRFHFFHGYAEFVEKVVPKTWKRKTKRKAGEVGA